MTGHQMGFQWAINQAVSGQVHDYARHFRVCAINHRPKCTNGNQISRISLMPSPFTVQSKLQKSVQNNQYSGNDTSEWFALDHSAHALSSAVCEVTLNILILIYRRK